MIDVTAIPAFTDNYIWLLRGLDDPHRVAVVDPGDAAPVIDRLSALELRLEHVLITHHHADHVGGLGDLRAAFPDMRVWGPEGSGIRGLDHIVGEGSEVLLSALGLRFEVLEVPGHTLDHIAYHGHGCAFVGDTMFMSGCGRLFEGSPSQMLASLDRLSALPASTSVYCAHEYTMDNLRFARAVLPQDPAFERAERTTRALREAGHPSVPSTVGDQLERNPFLRCDGADLVTACSDWSGQALTDRLSVFTALRRWKDGFR